MKRRMFAFLMALIMLVSTVPTQVLATSPEENVEPEMYFIDDTIWMPEGEEPTAAVVETGKWVKTEETMTESQLVCSEIEHTHRFNCTVDAEGNDTCGGQEDHTHVTDGCASDCAVAEHVHGEACSQQTTLVKWTVALKEEEVSVFGSYGSNLGWEYAKIQPKNNGGFDLTDPRGAEHLGQYVTVTINGQNSVEGTGGIKSRVLSRNSTGVVNISASTGYYIDQIVLACYMPSYYHPTKAAPFNCETAAGDNAYEYVLSESTPTNVTIALSDLYRRANHDSNVADYFLMIQLAPLPAPVYVGYDSGVAGGHDIAARPVSETGDIAYTSGTQAYTATPVGSYPTWSYPTAAATHNTLSISPEAEAEANAHGYSFAGWQLEYYTQYTESGNVFSGEMSVGGTNLYKGTPVTLTVHAKLTAIWQPMEHISVSKVWNDSNNQDGIRPDSVEIHLLRNGKHNGDPVVLSAANSWTAEWTVPSKDEDGNAINWAVEEVLPAGYTYDVTGDAKTGFVVTNTHILERTNVQVQKVWNDDNNRDGVRPYGVQVQLYSNGEAVTSYTDASGKEISGAAILTEAGSWSHEWDGLVKSQVGGTGADNVYTVKEIGYVDKDGNAIANPGYQPSESKDAETGLLLITNTRASATMNIPVQKVWNDNDNQDGKRPASITVTLTANGEKTDKTLVLNQDNQWKGTFENVYVYANGVPIYYSVVENEVAGYSVAVSGNATEGYVVTNTHTPEMMDVPVSKIWDDANDQDGKRPTSVTVQLYADNVAVEGKTLTLDAGGNWNGSFNGLPKYRDGGKAIVYTVAETAVPDGYTASVSGTTITNTHTPETATLKVTKVWEDANNQDGKRSDAVVITLYANGHPLLKDSAGNLVFESVADETGYTRFTVILDETNNWTSAWNDMPRYHNGQRISYSTVETGYYEKNTAGERVYHNGVPEGYTVNHGYAAGHATVTNTYAPEKTDLNVQKVWDDNDNRAGKRPASVTVTLTANGVPTGEPVTLNPANEWDYTFTDLPRYSDGVEIVYGVIETALDPALGYEAPKYTLDADSRILTVTNTRAAERISVTVTKEWIDANNQDGIRPNEIEVTLYANGIKTGETRKLELQSDGTWSAATFENLHKHYGGKEVVYTVVETPVSGYSAAYAVTDTAQNGSVTIKVTNTHTTEKVSLPVSKIWEDTNDQDGKRPEAVEVTLFADEVATEHKTVLHAGNNWRATFDGLDKNKAGAVAIAYTVQETGYYVTYNPGGKNSRTDGVPAGYDVAYNGTTITNTHVTDKVSISAEKKWDDLDDNDDVRPDSIILHLLANGEHTGKTAEVKANTEGKWLHTWTDLPKYAEGKEINYTVYEEVTEGLQAGAYSASYERTGNHVTITNSRNADKISFSVQKIWHDANNQDNVRYKGVKVQLYANGVKSGEPVELNADNHWVHTWTDLYKNNDGNAIVYTVKEVKYVTADGDEIFVSDTAPGYTAGEKFDTLYDEETAVDTFTGITTIVNTHEVDKTSVKVQKKWDDDNNRDGIRPASVTVTLYQNGQPTANTVVLDADNNWTATFSGRLDVHHGIGIDNVYTVVEQSVAGYESKITGNAAEGFVITNTHKTETVDVPVSKIWNDADDQDGMRPDSITVQLYADNVAVEGKTLTLDADSNWQGTFIGLPKYRDGGKTIVYTVAETKISEGYTASVSGTTITNSREPEVMQLNVKKVWDDANNQDGKRPYAVQVMLYANGQPLLKDSGDNLVFGAGEAGVAYEQFTLILNEKNDWSGSWRDMPRYHNGQRISYTVVENGYIQNEGGTVASGVPAGYTVDHDYKAVDGTGNAYATVTNFYTPELTDLNVQKVWDDDDNRAGKRPASVTVELYSNGVATGQTAELNPANEWDHTFLNLPKYSGGKRIAYSVVETPLDATLGYEAAKYELDAQTRIATVINTRHDEKIDVTVNKVWDDADNQDGKRPTQVQVTLYANGIDTGVSKVLDANNNWSAAFTDLYRHYSGKEVVYTVMETPVNGYTAAYKITADNVGNVTIQVKNTHAPEMINIPVSKVWDDNRDQDGIRPEHIEVTLYADGVSTGKTAVLGVENNWQDSTTFVDLPEFANGKAIVYTVKENTAAEGYNVTNGVAQAAAAGVVDGKIELVNVHKPAEVTVKATKVWDDDNDRDGKRPDSIVVHLLANGAHTGMSRIVSAETGWYCEWKNLPKYENGNEIVYTVYEEMPAEDSARAITDYVASYTYDPNDWNNITITNTYKPETIEVVALKVWNDDTDRDGLRLASVEVELYADGKATGKKLTLNESNNWNDQWINVLKFRDGGVPIEYTVKETSVPFGYTADVRSDEFAANMYIVTNTHASATTDVSVNKIWADENNNDGKRPDGIIVQLYANGSAVEGARVELNSHNNWSYVWFSTENHPLYVFDKGEEISYYVDEIGYVIDGEEFDELPEGYTKTLSTEDYTTSITNTRETEKLSVSVKKVWRDSDNNDGIRPEKVTVTLFAGTTEVEKVELSETNEWTHTWTGLYKYMAGEELKYTVQEAEVKGYEVSYTAEATADGSVNFTVTNTHELETKVVTVSKVWKDNNDAEGYRTDSVKVRLYKNGTAYGDPITLSKSNQWKYSVTVPVYEDGKQIIWTVSEVKVPKYYSVSYDQNTLTVTNTIQSKEIPKTGDASNLLFWMSTMFLCCASATVLLVTNKRKWKL